MKKLIHKLIYHFLFWILSKIDSFLYILNPVYYSYSYYDYFLSYFSCDSIISIVFLDYKVITFYYGNTL